jgi:hypothetical protein
MIVRPRGDGTFEVVCPSAPRSNRDGTGGQTMNVAIITRWETRRIELAKLHAQVDGAALIEGFLGDLESLTGNEPAVSLVEASRRSGYSADHLGKLIRSGRLQNHGRLHAPAVRLSECPKKTTLATNSGRAYNADADARSLVSTRR